MNAALRPFLNSSVLLGQPARPQLAPGTVLGRLKHFEARLARGEDEIVRAQALRHRVFFGGENQNARDADRYDAVCDHLLVIDTAQGREGRIVGTYRLIRQEEALRAGGFYSADEFAIKPMLRRNTTEKFLELGRSCVDPDYRGRGPIEVLWQAIWAYVGFYGVTVMMGCASFPGTIPAAHAEALSFLAHSHHAEGPLAVRARADRFCCMDLIPVEAVNSRRAMLKLPPLLKGYLRLGASIGQGCVVDRKFNTTDVFVALPVGAIGQRYIDHYAGDAVLPAGARAA